VGWEIFSQLSRSGVRSAFVDLDQLGICYPAPEDDPDNHRVKSGNLGATWPAFRDAGIRCLVISGGVDTAGWARAYTELVPGTALTLCRLRASKDVLRDRILRRGSPAGWVDRAMVLADVLDRDDVTDLRVDTDGRTVREVARLVREGAGGWPPLAGSDVPVATAGRQPRSGVGDAGPTPILWLCGPRGVGKSTVGWEVFVQVMADGVKAAYIDLSQVGHCRPAPDDDPGNHRIKARNVAAMWRTYRTAGARCLILSGHVGHRDTVRAYADAVPGAVLSVCRLRAGPDQLTERILLRGRGGGPAIPGDELNGLQPDVLRAVARDAVRQGDRLEEAGVGDACVDTDGRSVEDLARLVRALAGGWPRLPLS
jgi:hypothetical protein